MSPLGKNDIGLHQLYYLERSGTLAVSQQVFEFDEWFNEGLVFQEGRKLEERVLIKHKELNSKNRGLEQSQQHFNISSKLAFTKETPKPSSHTGPQSPVFTLAPKPSFRTGPHNPFFFKGVQFTRFIYLSSKIKGDTPSTRLTRLFSKIHKVATLSTRYSMSDESNSSKRKKTTNECDSDQELAPSNSEFENRVEERFKKASKRVNILSKSLKTLNEKMDEIFKYLFEISSSLEEFEKEDVDNISDESNSRTSESE
ncbi:hypothetical protein V8G54_003837 [Vigna mungo]|uniref:Uncharacterized protein n=1 Tax=Vigna mungo TaxID=3915 RepID=A0AAQ3SDH7_VIGMU